MALVRTGSGWADPERFPLDELAARSRPTSLAGERILPVVPALAQLLPGSGLRRGTTLVVSGADGATFLTLSLLAGPSSAGSVCAVVGMASLGLVAAAELGVDLSRLALVPRPGNQWPTVAASLLDALDVVVVVPVSGVRPSDARRLSERARHRGAVMIVLPDRHTVTKETRAAVAAGQRWPGPVDVRLAVTSGGWSGLGDGHLRCRLVEVAAWGRGSASRATRARLWLPSVDCRVEVAVAAGDGGSAQDMSAESGRTSVGEVDVGEVDVDTGALRLPPAIAG